MVENKHSSGGRPTKYSNRIPKCVMHYTKTCTENDNFPSIEGLAINLGVGSRTIYDWECIYPEFSQTLERLRDAQRDLLIRNGLNGKYSTSFSAFLLKAIHGFSDSKTIPDNTQNSFSNLSADVLADALEIMRQRDIENN